MQNPPALDAPQPLVQEPEPALPFRSDTILGVCEAVGQDFGFNPLYLRLVFAGLFYFNPLMVIGIYLALGAGVSLARWLYPVSATAAETAARLPDRTLKTRPTRSDWPHNRPPTFLKVPERKPKAA